MKDIVKLRNEIKRKQPVFRRQSSPKKVEVGTGWRKAKGCDSKVGSNRKGYLKKVKVGYKGPREARGLSRDGFNIILVNNIQELSNVDNKKDAVCIGSIGKRKKLILIQECIKKNLKIINIRDPQKFINDIEDEIKNRKDEKAKKTETKDIGKEKTDDKKTIEEKVDGEEKKTREKQGFSGPHLAEEEKKEKDKVLTKREI